MKLKLSGQSYRNAVLAAAAQQSLNLFAETIEDPGGSGKSLQILTAAPGYHQVADLNAHAGNVRGMWSGGGRVFICVGVYVYEINNSWAVVGSAQLLTLPDGSTLPNDGLPVQFFGNGSQLGLIAGGAADGSGIIQRYFFINNGSGFICAQFQISGTVDVAGTAVTWKSGDLFPTPFPTAMYINDIAVAVTSRNSTTSITLTSSFPGSGTGTVTTHFTEVYWVSGSTFSAGMKGARITINSVIYTVKSVNSIYVIILEDGDDAGIQIGVAYSVVQTNLTYSAAAGEYLTAQTGAYLDGQFYVQRIKTSTNPQYGRQVNFSAVNDGTSWSGLDFFLKESAADDIQSIIAHNKQLIVWGQQYECEVYQNDPNSGRPVLISGMVFQQPSSCRYVPQILDDKLYFIGGAANGGLVAFRVDGSTPTRISTHAIEQQWKATGINPANIIGWSYEDNGHFFWVIWFSSGSSWVYDVTEKYWHERAYWNGSTFDAYKITYHTFVPEWTSDSATLFGVHLVAGYASAKIYVMSTTYYDEATVNMKQVRAMPYLFNGGKRVFVGRVQVTQASGAQLYLDWSDDDGTSWSTPDTAPDTTTTPYFLAQGSFEHSAIPRLSAIGQVQVTLIECDAEYAAGTV